MLKPRIILQWVW